jgi:hypothetical protein
MPPLRLVDAEDGNKETDTVKHEIDMNTREVHMRHRDLDGPIHLDIWFGGKWIMVHVSEEEISIGSNQPEQIRVEKRALNPPTREMVRRNPRKRNQDSVLQRLDTLESGLESVQVELSALECRVDSVEHDGEQAR